MVECESDYHSAFASAGTHLAEKPAVLFKKPCNEHGGGELDVVDGVVDTRESLLYLAGVNVHDILMVDAELIELSKHVLCGVEVVFVLELDLIFLLLTNLEPFV